MTRRQHNSVTNCENMLCMKSLFWNQLISFLIRQDSFPIFISKGTAIMSVPKSPTLLHTQIRSKPRRHFTTSMLWISTPRIQARAMVSKNHNPSMWLVASHLGHLRVEPS